MKKKGGQREHRVVFSNYFILFNNFGLLHESMKVGRITPPKYNS